MDDMKTYTRCLGAFPVQSYRVLKTTGRGTVVRYSYCKECSKAVQLAWRKKNPEKASWSGANTALKAKFGITLHDYDRMLKEQSGGCAICHQPPTSRRLHVDHCHATGVVRGLLCNNCNRGIGHLKESETIMRAAIEYVKERYL